MIVFAKYGPYERREFVETCFEKYLDTIGRTKLSETVREERTANNKPYFKDYPDIRFSISHSGDLAVLAMTDTEVGIDIEEIKERNFQPIVNRQFTDGEKSEAVDLTGFLKVWTKKEAYLKLTGDGLSGLSGADVSQAITLNGKRLLFTPLDVFEGYVGAIVAEEQPVIFMQLD